MEVPYAAHLEDLDVSDATFAAPDLTTFCRLDELGLVAVGQRLEPRRAVVACRVVEPDEWCHRCGQRGVLRDTVAASGHSYTPDCDEPDYLSQPSDRGARGSTLCGTACMVLISCG